MDRWGLAGFVIVLVATAVPRTPRGICLDDAGELQLACTVGGVMHPPGYGGYVLLGRCLTWIPVFEPAYRVTLATTGAAVAAMTLLVLLLVRLGTPMLMAVMLGLLLTWHKRVWQNLVTPEVYAPSWVLLATAIYFTAKFARTQRRRELLISGAAFGLLLGSRSAAALFVPAILLGWWLAARRPGGKPWARTCTGCLGLCLGLFVCGAHLWHADRLDADYNYLAQYDFGPGGLPSPDAGFGARASRLHWLVSGRQFAGNLGFDLRSVRRQLRRANFELFGDQWILLPPFALLAAVSAADQWQRRRAALVACALLGGAAVSLIFFDLLDACWMFLPVLGALAIAGSIDLWRRQPALVVLAWSVITGGVVYVLGYDVSDQAQDMLPILTGGVILLGAAAAAILRRRTSRVWTSATTVSALALALVCVVDPFRRDSAGSADADGFVRELHMLDLPADSVILSGWPTAPALWYERLVTTGRRDITVVNAYPQDWPRRVEKYLDRPVYYVERTGAPAGWTYAPDRNVWRLVPE